MIEEWALRSLGMKDWNLVKTYSNRFIQLPFVERHQLTRQVGDILFTKIGLETGDKTDLEMENMLLVLYLILKEEWEFEL